MWMLSEIRASKGFGNLSRGCVSAFIILHVSPLNCSFHGPVISYYLNPIIYFVRGSMSERLEQRIIVCDSNLLTYVMRVNMCGGNCKSRGSSSPYQRGPT